jgi:hypothetical protein
VRLVAPDNGLSESGADLTSPRSLGIGSVRVFELKCLVAISSSQCPGAGTAR